MSLTLVVLDAKSARIVSGAEQTSRRNSCAGGP